MADWTDFQQRALYGSGQIASRAGQLFKSERDALWKGDTRKAKHIRSRANALNRQGAYAAVRGMGGNEGKNQYFPVQSSGQPIYSTNFPGQFALSSQGKEVFNQFRDSGFIEPIRQKKRYAPNTEPKGLGWLMEKALENTMVAKIASNMLPEQKPKPDDAYYKSLWGKGLNEMYSPSGIFSAGKFLGKPNIDPYYRKNYTGPEFLRGLLEPFHKPRSDAFGVVRDSSIPEDWEFMQEKPLDALPYTYGIKREPYGIKREPGDGGEMPDPFFMEREWEAPYAGVEDVTITDVFPTEDEVEDITETITEDEIFNEEVFNKNFELWTPFGDPSDYPEMFGGAGSAYELYEQLEEAHGISGDELLQKMIDEKVIKERIDDDLAASKYPSQLRVEDKVKRMSLEELEGLIEDQEKWSGEIMDI